jgi:superfamily II DNA or RNA helicase
MDYKQFIESKKHSSLNYGIEPMFTVDSMFDFQKHITEYAIKKGRCAIFLDTGLGKTVIELTVASNFVRSTNRPVLIITPLAVANQFIKEAEKFGIDDVEHTKDGRFTKKIILVNYERLHYMNSSDFDCVILDESSILKNFDGAIKQQVTTFLKKVKYRFLFTATPSPNDYVELGTSSEALGYFGYMDMLSKFFKNNQNNVAKLSQISKARQGEEWYLKPHAENDFWQWVASWSVSAKKPSDLGFNDEKFILPRLHEIETIIRNETPLVINGQGSLFALPAVGFKEIKAEAKVTINQRCEMAVEKALNHETSVYWCNLNNEADAIMELDKQAIEVRGNMDIDKKEDILLNFANGSIKKLVTKTSITAFGLNWQHCNHTTYFPTYSYEQYYQAIRRFWRFGQTKPVTVDLILSDGQERIMQSLLVKKDKAIRMFEKLTQQTNVDFTIKTKEFNKEVIKPKFI